jgi:hypothetical protein
MKNLEWVEILSETEDGRVYENEVLQPRGYYGSFMSRNALRGREIRDYLSRATIITTANRPTPGECGDGGPLRHLSPREERQDGRCYFYTARFVATVAGGDYCKSNSARC